ncbi:TRASH domain-containing protein [Caldivirga sp.]|uniref:TRASH domain-containing protein n=1 Tax=Caldivirga sp. TaxID=2080243 RepID=UPI003D0D0178
MVIVKAPDFNNLIKLINDVKDKESVYVALEPASTVAALPRLVCDYCGGPINGSPITYKRGRRVLLRMLQNMLKGT